jgi:hypothetical protein
MPLDFLVGQRLDQLYFPAYVPWLLDEMELEQELPT